MIPQDKLYESILRRLILEAAAPKTEGLAMLVQDTGSLKVLVLYNSNSIDAFRNIKTPHNTWQVYNTIVKGYAAIAPSEYGPCNGAWEVRAMAGPGFGKIMYGCCYAASPSKKLMPDRSTVSPPAGAAWKKAFDSDRPRKKFDNIKARKKETPDDPSDDCKVHTPRDSDCSKNGTPKRPWLNYSYSAAGWEKALLAQLEVAHETNLRKLETLPKKLDITKESFQGDLIDYGIEFFQHEYESMLLDTGDF